MENSEHIDPVRARKNIYWDCYQGFTSELLGEGKQKYSFEDVERIYYFEHYADHVQAQNERNEKSRHTERNRTVNDLLKNNKTCPEESIYQIGTIEESVSGETLALIAAEFFSEIQQRYGEHFHILDWASHVGEGTPHIHERHVFDCKNRYGELCPQQEKALEMLNELQRKRREAVQRITSQEANKIVVWTNEALIPAQRTYESTGFQFVTKTGETFSEYAGQRIHDEIIVKHPYIKLVAGTMPTLSANCLVVKPFRSRKYRSIAAGVCSIGVLSKHSLKCISILPCLYS